MGKVNSSRETKCVPSTHTRVRVSIISEVRFFRESLAQVLPRQGMLSIFGLYADLNEALRHLANHQPDVILLDEAFPDGLAAVGKIGCVAPQLPVVVIAVAETAEEIIAWAEAGTAGYIPKTVGLADIVPLLVGIVRGEQACSESVAAGLLRRLSGASNANGRHQTMISSPALTAREAQIARLIAEGMINKEIARRLNIGLATAKTHVHHLLGKLNLQRRGQAASWMRGQSDNFSNQ